MMVEEYFKYFFFLSLIEEMNLWFDLVRCSFFI